MSLASKWFGFGRNSDFDEGVRAYERGDFEDAIQSFAACAETCRDPSTQRLAGFYLGESLLRRAEGLLEAGNPKDAKRFLERAADLHPHYPDLQFRLAQACRDSGDEAGEQAHLDSALDLHPKYVDALLYKAALHFESGQTEEGLDALKRAAESGSGLPVEGVSRVRAACESGDLELAIRAVRELAEAHRDDANALAREGDKQAHDKEFEEAARAYELALRYAPNYADVRCKYGQTLLELDRVEQALEEFERALQVNPKYVEALAQKGIALRRLGRESEAHAAFARAAELDPHHVIASQEAARLSS